MSAPLPATSRWRPEQVAAIGARPWRQARRIVAADVAPMVAGLDLWDLWPVQEADGAVARFGDVELWIALSAPAVGDPVERHGRARLRSLARRGDRWRDLGALFPDDFSPGSREWSGSALVDASHASVTVFFTAAGRRGETRPTYEQRLFQTRGTVVGGVDDPRLGHWTSPALSVASDNRLYDPADQAEGAVGEIKAFRDPAFFRDPADGAAYLLFAASLPPPSSAFNGAVGLARANDERLDSWTLLPPILEADGLCNELERPHVLVHDGLYYLFWSTQREVFHPGGPAGPTGLYGMVAPSLRGPYEPLNGTGLVLGNPPDAPFQTYSWLVAKDLTVSAFVNYWAAEGPDGPTGEAARSVFGGVVAPFESVVLHGPTSR